MNWRYDTLPDMLTAASASDSGIRFLSDETCLSYRALHATACELAGKLQARGVVRGDRIVVILPIGATFATLWWAVQLTGAVPCVLSASLIMKNRETGQLGRLTAKLGAKLIVTTRRWGTLIPDFSVLTDEALSAQPASEYRPTRPAEFALIQATSGSTSAPKCVALTHENVLANLEQIGRILQTTPSDVVVSWLPLFHDMGLIGCFLFSIYWQLPLVMLSQTQFLRRPHRWLEAIGEYGGTLSPAPNFAYALANKRTPDDVLTTLDLSSWRSAMCGAEPIDSDVLSAFAVRFAACGFAAQALTPCYGLAEATLCVSMKPAGERPITETVRRDVLAADNRAVVATDARDAISVVDCGVAVEGMEIVIVDQDGARCGEGEIGRIHLSSPSVMSGYLDAPHTGDWLDTGDLGYLRDGHLFVLGRHKELIIINGQNYQPTDFERVAATVNGVRAGGVVALGIYNPAVASEELHLVCEVADVEDSKDVCEQMRGKIGRCTGVPPVRVTLVPPRTLPRTTSGKLQRNLVKTYCHQLVAERI